MMKVTKKLVTIVLAVVMVLGFVPTNAKAEIKFEKATIPQVTSFSDAAVKKPMVIANQTSSGVDHVCTNYYEFTLTEDSWVYFGGEYGKANHTGVKSCVNFYTDKELKSEIKEFAVSEGIYSHFGEDKYGFLPAGTYYMTLKTHMYEFSGNGGTDFVGEVIVYGATMPVSKCLELSKKANGYKSVTVSWENKLSDYMKYAQYQPGEIALSKVNDEKTWKGRIQGVYIDGNDNCVIWEPQKGTLKYSMTAQKNGAYTYMIYAGNVENYSRYSAVVNVTEIDNVKPVVKGVKNNKTYKKKVKITFSDKQSGIKSATLNGKKIKSGKKVSKKGKYTLIVKDKAGNKTTVKFKIKK